MPPIPPLPVGKIDASAGDEKSSLFTLGSVAPISLQSSGVHDFHHVDLGRQSLTHNLAAFDRASTLPASVHKSSPRPVGSFRVPGSGRSREGSQDTLSHGAPHGDRLSVSLLDIMKNLDEKVSSHYVSLNVSIAGSLKQVANTCNHIMRQCDGLAVRMKLLEDKITDSTGLRADLATRRSNVAVGSRESTTVVWATGSEQHGGCVTSQPSPLAEQAEAWRNLLLGELATQEAILHGLVERVEKALRSKRARFRTASKSSESPSASQRMSDLVSCDSSVPVAQQTMPTPTRRDTATRDLFTRSIIPRDLREGMLCTTRHIIPRGVMQEPVTAGSCIVPSWSTLASSASRPPWLSAAILRISSAIRSTFPLMPDSVLATASDMMGCLFLCLDACLLPYQLAWNLHRSSGFLFLSCTAAMFWTIDMCRHFATCIVRGDILITALPEIVCHYLKHSFILDLFLVTIEWMGLVFEIIEGSGRERNRASLFISVLKVLRVLRISRAFRLLRSGRFANIHELVMAKSERLGCVAMVRVLLAIGQLIFFILWLCHVMACAWVGLQANGWRDTASSWEVVISEQHQEGATSFEEAGLSDNFKYLIAYYWSLTTLFSGESFLDPMTTSELYYAISFVLFGVLFASSIISSMAAIFVTNVEENRERKKKFNKLCAFLRQRHIDRTLSLIIQYQVSQRTMAKSNLAESDIAVLSFLSAEVKSKLQYSLRSHMFHVHPLWRACVYEDDHIIHNLCNLAVNTETYQPGYILFEEGEALEQSYTIISGTMQYTQTVATGSNFSILQRAEGPSLLVSTGDNFCELALWTHWETLGLMETISPCELLVCSCQGLMAVLGASNYEAEIVICGYAEALLAFIDTENPVYLNDLSSTIDFDSVVAFMDQKPRMQMSMPGWKAYREQTPYSGLGESLQREIHEGKCNLVINQSGVVLRVVRICVVHLRRPDGLLCVQIGTIKLGVPIVNIQLPGKKLRMQEALQTCVARVIDQLFHISRSNITVEGATFGRESSTSIERESTKFGLPTKYVRYAGQATLGSCAELEIRNIERCDDSAIECFVLPDGEDTSIKNVFAWMPDREYESMSNSFKAAEINQLVTQWLDLLLMELSCKGMSSEPWVPS